MPWIPVRVALIGFRGERMGERGAGADNEKNVSLLFTTAGAGHHTPRGPAADVPREYDFANFLYPFHSRAGDD